MFLAKFAHRLSILSDEVACISFNSVEGNAEQYSLKISSDHMSSEVTNKNFDGLMRDHTDSQAEYATTLRKEVFLKFFSILKQPGYVALKMNHNAKLEMDFTWEKN